MVKKRVKKAHLLLAHFVLEEMHITSTHIQLAKTNRMTPAICMGCWNMQSLDRHVLPSNNSAPCKGRTQLWWSASHLRHSSHLSGSSALSAPFSIRLELTPVCFIQRLCALKKFCQLKQVQSSAARQARHGNSEIQKPQCRVSSSSEEWGGRAARASLIKQMLFWWRRAKETRL